MKQPKFITDLFTGPDGETLAIGRVAAPFIGLAGFGLPYYQTVVQHVHVSLSEFGILIGSVVGGITALIRITHNTEPPGPDGLVRPAAPPEA